MTVFHIFLFNAMFLGIFYHFKSSFIASSDINFSLSLSLFLLLPCLSILLYTLVFLEVFNGHI